MGGAGAAAKGAGSAATAAAVMIGIRFDLMALGASGRKTTRYRFQGTVPFFEITGSLVNLRSDHAR